MMKKIPVGMMDFQEIRTDDYYYVDKTMYLEKLEFVSRFLMFLRPRRFGKTLFANMMKAYYDINTRELFPKLFDGLYVGTHPTPLRNSFLILQFDFSWVTVSEDLNAVQASFKRHCTRRCLDFLHNYSRFFPDGLAEQIAAIPSPGEQVERISVAVSNAGQRCYVFIDEYDNFVNSILSQPMGGHERYASLTHGEGFFRSFFTFLKGGASYNAAGISRIYLTGVTPIALDDVTSGFNIVTNISMDSEFNAMNGFTLDELKTMLAYYREARNFTDPPERHIDAMKAWYDNYCFNHKSIGQCVFNTDMVLTYMNFYARHGTHPDSFMDYNARTDFEKLRHLVRLDRDLRGIQESPEESTLLELARTGETIAMIKDRFTLNELIRPASFKSFLFCLGVISFARVEDSLTILRIPNLTVQKLVFDYISQEMGQAIGFRIDLDKLRALVMAMALKGEWEPVLAYMAELVRTQLGIRDFIDREKGPQLLHCVFLGLPAVFRVEHERELNLGFHDLALLPDFASCPDAAFSYLFEFKYISADKQYDATEEKLLTQHLTAAAEAVARYRADPHMSALLGGTKLLCIAVVYRGCRMLKATLVP